MIRVFDQQLAKVVSRKTYVSITFEPLDHFPNPRNNVIDPIGLRTHIVLTNM